MAKNAMSKLPIGFIGQGFIGKSYADDFERRGYKVVRYALEEPYRHNGDKLKGTKIVFVAVPTPTTPKGFDDSVVRSAIAHAPPGSIVVIKSTILPGTTASIQKQYPDRVVLYSPEFLSEATAAHDAAHPKRNIIGLAVESPKHSRAAQRVLSVLPKAPFKLVCKATEAEFIKYGGNNWFYFKVMFINMLYDLVQEYGCDYDVVRAGMAQDPRVGTSHLIPIHKSGTLGSDNFHLLRNGGREKRQRGAGGHCFIKDFAAFSQLYRETLPKDSKGIKVLEALDAKNIELLITTGKDLDLLAGVYGKAVLKKHKSRTHRTKK